LPADEKAADKPVQRTDGMTMKLPAHLSSESSSNLPSSTLVRTANATVPASPGRQSEEDGPRPGESPSSIYKRFLQAEQRMTKFSDLAAWYIAPLSQEMRRPNGVSSEVSASAISISKAFGRQHVHIRSEKITGNVAVLNADGYSMNPFANSALNKQLESALPADFKNAKKPQSDSVNIEMVGTVTMNLEHGIWKIARDDWHTSAR
jgi:hypothetical protein